MDLTSLAALTLTALALGFLAGLFGTRSRRVGRPAHRQGPGADPASSRPAAVRQGGRLGRNLCLVTAWSLYTLATKGQ